MYLVSCAHSRILRSNRSGWGLKLCISDKLTGDAYATRGHPLRTTTSLASSLSSPFQLLEAFLLTHLPEAESFGPFAASP